MTAVLLAALLSLMPHAPYGECLAARRGAITADAKLAAATAGVPVGLLLAVGWRESHLGCNPRSGGSWGNPISATRRHVAGRPAGAARILARGRRLCGDWRGAAAFFRTGECRVDARHAGYVAAALQLTARIYARAGLPSPRP